MFFQILLVCITLFILYRFVWRPWKLQKHYVKQFKAKNYRVLEIPFRPFQIGFLKVYDMSEGEQDSVDMVVVHPQDGAIGQYIRSGVYPAGALTYQQKHSTL